MGRIRLAVVLFACVVAINCGNSSPTNPEAPSSGGGSGSGGGGTGGGTGQTAVYTDAVFNDNDWQDTIVQLFGAGGSALVGHRTVGGAGDNTDYRRIELKVADAQGAQVAAFCITRGNSYFPSSDGAILSIDYSEDSILVSGGGSQSSAPALMQDGKLYTLAVGSAFSTPETGWTHHSLTGLKQNDFRTLASESEHPNFSSSGTRIDPGFMRLYTVAGGDNISGIDNWRITLYR